MPPRTSSRGSTSTPSAPLGGPRHPADLRLDAPGHGGLRRAGRLGFPCATGRPWKGRAIEVFPHATAAVLAGCLAPKGMRKRAWREQVLQMAGARTEELTTLDQIDAALAALTGLAALRGQVTALG